VDVILLIKAAVMGIVEGLTEFLPISSTGHLILTGSLLGGFGDDRGKVFDIAIQTGAIFAVILVYWQRLQSTVVGLGSDPKARRFALNVLIGFLPAAVLGLAFGKIIKEHLFTPVVVASTFIIGGFIIILAERLAARNVATPSRIDIPWGATGHPRASASGPRVPTVDDMTPLAMIPGTSRSGSTIIGGMLLGLSRQAATDFSFFLAIPTLIGAGAYSLWKARALLSMADLPLFLVGLVFSFIFAWLCVRWLLRYVATHTFVPFAWYRIAFGLLILVTAYTGMVDWHE